MYSRKKFDYLQLWKTRKIALTSYSSPGVSSPLYHEISELHQPFYSWVTKQQQQQKELNKLGEKNKKAKFISIIFFFTTS